MAPFRRRTYVRPRPTSTRPYPARARSAARRGRTGYANVLTRSLARTLNRRVDRLTSMIETKETTRQESNVQLPHNNIWVSTLNPFNCTQGTGDPMEANFGNRIGDKISIRGLMIRGFLENSLGRAKVHFRVMLLKAAKGDPFTRANLFKGDSNNKMIDQLNTERYTLIAQKTFNIIPTNPAPSAVGTNGIPTTATVAGITGRTFKMWIPGRKFGRNGNVQYENGSTTQVKFFDYRIVILAYDWYGTPQDVNNVGFLNEMYTKLYFKDA